MIPFPLDSKDAGVRHRRPARRRLGPSRPAVFCGTIFRLRPRVEWMEDRTLLSTFTVTNTDDSGPGSLRQAILDSNAATSQTNTIDFQITGSGVRTILPLSSLPAIAQPVLIDGFSQPGYAGTPMIEIDGTQGGGGDGLTITGPDVTVRGLDTNNFSQGAGIHITGTGATGAWIYGNFLGTDPTGTQAEPNNEGVEIDAGATQNLVGTNGDGVNDAAERNIISGNLSAGVLITGQGTNANVVAGDKIGTDVTGTLPLGNQVGGMLIQNGASDNTIGGTSPSARDVISGNVENGVNISVSGTTGNVVEGDYIGVTANGAQVLANTYNGVAIFGGASGNIIGGTAPGSGDVLSGNTDFGVYISDVGTSGNVVEGDDVGADPSGTLPLGNQVGGVLMQSGASDNTIGGTGPSARDVISGNVNNGVDISESGTTGNVVEGDYIGVTANGAQGLANTEIGVAIYGGASANIIGGTAPGAGDVVTGNTIFGVYLSDAGTADNVVAGDLIGTDSTGLTAIGNGSSGVWVQSGASDNTIGGTTPGARDVISANGSNGIDITGAGTTGNVVEGDYLGVAADGSTVLRNYESGIAIWGGTTGNTVGGTAAGAGDVISGNFLGDGVYISDSGTADNVVAGDLIGTDSTGIVAVPNDSSGVSVQDGASDNTIGGTTPAARDVISGNGLDGIDFIGAGATGNVLEGDFIGLTENGAQALPNSFDGISIEAGASGNVIGGTAPGAGDVISGNGDVLGGSNSGFGVIIRAVGTTGNVVEGDDIGTDATGTIAVGNSSGGVQIEDGAADNSIGGTTVAAGNLITDNGGPGVVVGTSANDTTVGDEIIGNRIFGNSGQAIDLADDGVTDNGAAPRSGPNNFQNYPIIFTGPGGQVEGWLGGSEPNTVYRIDIFASTGSGPGGAGEAQDYLGSLTEPTDATGQITFVIPFTAPVGLPVITATATDPAGNTSELTNPRVGALELPSQVVRLSADGTQIFSSASGDAIAIQGANAGPPSLTSEIALAVSAGTLSLATTAGLVGSGNQTGSLLYTGPLSALNAALTEMTYAAPAGFEGNVSFRVQAQSDGVAPVSGQFIMTTGSFVVTTTADSGPGSLRQAILESNTAIGGSNTIQFDIPGTGVHTIAPASPLPAITFPVVIDGTTQPGYAGTALIAIAAASTASPLVIANGDVTIRGLDIDGVAIDPPSSARLIAGVLGEGSSGQLSLLDSHGAVVVQSQDAAPGGTGGWINEYVAAGVYSLATPLEGAATSTWTIMLNQATVPLAPVSVGPYANEVVAGAFTGNGKLDLAVSDSDGIQMLLGNGDGTFQPAQTVAAGISGALVAGDFTGDGRLDLAVEDGVGYGEQSVVAVLLGNDDGTFEPAVEYSLGSSFASGESIVAGDFTGNGRLDLAVTGSDSLSSTVGEVAVLLGNGNGTFQPPEATYPVGSYPAAIVAGDFTGNGKLDLAVSDEDGIQMLLGNGDGTFQPARTVAAGSESALVEGDFTGDGKLDLASLNNLDNTVSVLLGNGDGTFQPPVTYAAASDSQAMVAGDFTGNGRLDLAVDSSGSDTISVLLGNGDGTFQPQVTSPAAQGAAYNNGVGVIAVGQFTGDGRLDLAVVVGGVTAGQSGVAVLLGNGDGTFQPQVASSAEGFAGSGPYSIVVGDFTGDGREDLAVANYFGDSVSVFLGNGGGTFQPPVDYAVGFGPNVVVAADFNDDGRLDLAAAGQSGASDNFAGEVAVLLGNGDGTFQPQVTYPVVPAPAPTNEAYLAPSAVVAGDFTGDGRIDLAVVWLIGSSNSEWAEVSVLLGNGDGTFQPRVIYPVGPPPVPDNGGYVDPSAIVAGDFTADGRLDLAVAISSYNNDTPQGEVSVLLGNGDGTFEPAVQHPAGLSYNLGGMVAGDFTGDGRIDLAVAGQGGASDNYPGEVAVLLGDGDGTFQPAVLYPVGFDPNSIVAVDVAGDGPPDLAVLGANYDAATQTDAGELTVLLGNGDGTFQPGATYPVGSNPGAIVAGDFTGDGNLDLAFGSESSTGTNLRTVSVLRGNGDGTFSATGQADITPMANPLVADVNGDGTNDILVVDGSGDILYRQGIAGQPGTFEPPVTVNPNNPSRDIAWMPNTTAGPLLASVDAQENAISFYAYRNGDFVEAGSLPTGQAPAQIIAAELSGNGLTDLVVRNAGDGTLTVYFGAPFVRSNFMGPINPQVHPLTFLPAVTLTAGIGVSDVQAVDTTGSGALDLVVTNKLTAQVSILHNLGNESFAAPVPYRAGTGLSAVDASSTPEVTSLDATAGVAAGPLTPGGPTDLVTINPGSNTLDVLAGLGGGRFADPTTIPIKTPGTIIRTTGITGNGIVQTADFTGNGIDDLAVLTASGLSVYLGDGKGGFLPPTTYAVPPESDGLTVADLTGNGKLDLLVGDAFGDVLVLLGNGNGTFAPFHEANQAIELAVADLTGNGSEDVIYADQGLDRVVVDYGAGNSTVLANQATGLLEPGAVQLAYLAGPDNPPDLIVANSGSNNVLIYPGLGNGQFGPAINGEHGYFVGTSPAGITVANLTGALPDLIIADKGSNDVSVLVNQSQGGNISFEPAVRFPVVGSGPVATVVQNVPGGYPNLLVSNSGSNTVTLLPGRSPADFDVSAETTVPVGTDPGPIFAPSVNGQTDLVTVNAGSNDLTLISGFGGPNPVTSTIPSGGVDPDAAFAFSSGNGFEDLVVGNAGDGELALFEGGPGGLSLTSDTTEPNLPTPTSLVYAGLAGGAVQFYAATEGQEAAALVALSLGGQIAPVTPLFLSPTVAVPQLVPLQESSLALAGTLLIVALESPGGAVHLGAAETEAEAAAALSVSSAVPLTAGQSLPFQGFGEGDDGGGDEPAAEWNGRVASVPAPTIGPTWQRLILGTDEARERFDREHPELFPAGRDDQRETSPTGGEVPNPAPTQPVMPPGRGISPQAERRLEAIDRAIELRDGPDEVTLEGSSVGEQPVAVPWRSRNAGPEWTAELTIPHLSLRPCMAGVPAQQVRNSGQAPPVRDSERLFQLSAALALAASALGVFGVRAADGRARTRTFSTALRGWPAPRRGARDTRPEDE